MRKLRYGRILRVGLIVLGIIGMMALSPAHAVAATSLWYNGNYNLNDAFTNQNNVPVNFGGSYGLEKSLVYDDFIVPVGQSWNLSSLYIDDQLSYYVLPTKATWEIRSGMSAGQGGTLLFSGDTTATNTLLTAANGNSYIDPEYQISTAVTGVTLGAGVYWVAVAPDSGGYYGDQSYIETTSGAAAIGLPTGNDGNSFLNNNLTGPEQLTFAPSILDFSAGVNGTVTLVPEPGGLRLLAAGLAFAFGLGQRRHRPALCPAV